MRRFALRYETSRFNFHFLSTFYFHVEKAYCIRAVVVLQITKIVRQKISHSNPYYQNYKYNVIYNDGTQSDE